MNESNYINSYNECVSARSKTTTSTRLSSIILGISIRFVTMTIAIIRVNDDLLLLLLSSLSIHEDSETALPHNAGTNGSPDDGTLESRPPASKRRGHAKAPQ